MYVIKAYSYGAGDFYFVFFVFVDSVSAVKEKKRKKMKGRRRKRKRKKRKRRRRMKRTKKRRRKKKKMKKMKKVIYTLSRTIIWIQAVGKRCVVVVVEEERVDALTKSRHRHPAPPHPTLLGGRIRAARILY